ncbi:uncharacterized protein LOC113333228 [Papaver somniferum]|uniref:uncharacterized protein LOC113333228 n=1 Tax=Papaver somniferum TaxID=3469 RepID=UPI000E6FCE2C|nr:uncharacterized protein LOC113333228 [Papaver somniferum]
MIWVHYPGLSLEYWDEKTLFTISRALGNPVKVDTATLNYDSGYYARVLVEINLAKSIPNKLWIKTKFGGFIQKILLTNLPKFCPNCKIVGHTQNECKSQKKSTTDSPVKKVEVNSGKIHESSPKAVMEKFDICETPVIHIHIPTSKGQKSIPLTPEKILQLVEDNTLESSVIKYINGTTGTVSEERVLVTSWSKIIQKPASTVAASTSTSETLKLKADPKFNPSLVFIAEQKIACTASFCNKLNLPGLNNMVIHNSVSNKKGNIWLFWNKNLPVPTVISMSSQMITFSIRGVLVSGVHAHVGVMQRRFLWSEMELVSNLNQPWLAIGDFNAVTSCEKTIGGRAANRKAILDFTTCLDKCGLMQSPKSGVQHSWSNFHHGDRIILCNLDRVVFNQLWLQHYEDWGYKVGLRISSDHAPLLGGNVNIPNPKNIPKRFQKMWISHPGFMDVVLNSWNEEIIGGPAYIFQGKLKRLKKVLSDWNWNEFGNINVKIKEAEEKVKEAMLRSDDNPFNDNCLNNLVEAQNDLNSKEVQLSTMLKQKAITKWNWRTTMEKSFQNKKRLLKS